MVVHVGCVVVGDYLPLLKFSAPPRFRKYQMQFAALIVTVSHGYLLPVTKFILATSEAIPWVESMSEHYFSKH
jgi:hypothetical protein